MTVSSSMFHEVIFVSRCFSVNAFVGRRLLWFALTHISRPVHRRGLLHESRFVELCYLPFPISTNLGFLRRMMSASSIYGCVECRLDSRNQTLYSIYYLIVILIALSSSICCLRGAYRLLAYKHFTRNRSMTQPCQHADLGLAVARRKWRLFDSNRYTYLRGELVASATLTKTSKLRMTSRTPTAA